MNVKAITGTMVLFALFGFAATASAQHEQGREEGKGQAQQQHSQPAQPHAQPAQRAQPAMRAKPTQHTQPVPHAQAPTQSSGGMYHGGVQPQAPTYGGVHHSGVPQHQEQVRAGFTQSQSRNWRDQHRNWGQRGGYSGYRVPDERFSLYFGENHFFRIGGLPLVFVGGYPRFQYDGYWVTFMDPWPEDWDPMWYQNDDVYLGYSDGYYIYDRNHPGIGIAVTISM